MPALNDFTPATEPTEPQGGLSGGAESGFVGEWAGFEPVPEDEIAPVPNAGFVGEWAGFEPVPEDEIQTQPDPNAPATAMELMPPSVPQYADIGSDLGPQHAPTESPEDPGWQRMGWEGENELDIQLDQFRKFPGERRQQTMVPGDPRDPQSNWSSKVTGTEQMENNAAIETLGNIIKRAGWDTEKWDTKTWEKTESIMGVLGEDAFATDKSTPITEFLKVLNSKVREHRDQRHASAGGVGTGFETPVQSADDLHRAKYVDNPNNPKISVEQAIEKGLASREALDVILWMNKLPPSYRDKYQFYLTDFSEELQKMSGEQIDKIENQKTRRELRNLRRDAVFDDLVSGLKEGRGKYNSDFIINNAFSREAALGAGQGELRLLGLAQRLLGYGEESDESVDRAEYVARINEALNDEDWIPKLPGWFGGGIASLTTMVAGGGSLTGMAVVAGATEGNEAYVEGRDAGLEGKKLAAFVAQQTAIETGLTIAFNKSGFSGLEGRIAGKAVFAATRKQLGKNIVREIGAELAEEITIEVLHDLTRKGYKVDPNDPNWSDTLEVIGNTVGQTIITMGMVQAHPTRQNLKTIRQQEAIDAFMNPDIDSAPPSRSDLRNLPKEMMPVTKTEGKQNTDYRVQVGKEMQSAQRIAQKLQSQQLEKETQDEAQDEAKVRDETEVPQDDTEAETETAEVQVGQEESEEAGEYPIEVGTINRGEGVEDAFVYKQDDGTFDVHDPSAKVKDDQYRVNVGDPTKLEGFVESPVEAAEPVEEAVTEATPDGTASTISDHLEAVVGAFAQPNQPTSPLGPVSVGDTVDVAWAGNPGEDSADTRVSGTAQVISVSPDGKMVRVKMTDDLASQLPDGGPSRTETVFDTETGIATSGFGVGWSGVIGRQQAAAEQQATEADQSGNVGTSQQVPTPKATPAPKPQKRSTRKPGVPKPTQKKLTDKKSARWQKDLGEMSDAKLASAAKQAEASSGRVSDHMGEMAQAEIARREAVAEAPAAEQDYSGWTVGQMITEVERIEKQTDAPAGQLAASQKALASAEKELASRRGQTAAEPVVPQKQLDPEYVAKNTAYAAGQTDEELNNTIDDHSKKWKRSEYTDHLVEIFTAEREKRRQAAKAPEPQKRRGNQNQPNAKKTPRQIAQESQRKREAAAALPQPKKPAKLTPAEQDKQDATVATGIERAGGYDAYRSRIESEISDTESRLKNQKGDGPALEKRLRRLDSELQRLDGWRERNPETAKSAELTTPSVQTSQTDAKIDEIRVDELFDKRWGTKTGNKRADAQRMETIRKEVAEEEAAAKEYPPGTQLEIEGYKGTTFTVVSAADNAPATLQDQAGRPMGDNAGAVLRQYTPEQITVTFEMGAEGQRLGEQGQIPIVKEPAGVSDTGVPQESLKSKAAPALATEGKAQPAAKEAAPDRRAELQKQTVAELKKLAPKGKKSRRKAGLIDAILEAEQKAEQKTKRAKRAKAAKKAAAEAQPTKPADAATQAADRTKQFLSGSSIEDLQEIADELELDIKGTDRKAIIAELSSNQDVRDYAEGLAREAVADQATAKQDASKSERNESIPDAMQADKGQPEAREVEPTTAQEKQMAEIAGKIGFDLRLVEGGEPSVAAWWNPDTKTVWFNRAGLRGSVDYGKERGQSPESVMWGIFAHEAFHAMRVSNPKAWNKFKEWLVQHDRKGLEDARDGYLGDLETAHDEATGETKAGLAKLIKLWNSKSKAGAALRSDEAVSRYLEDHAGDFDFWNKLGKEEPGLLKRMWQAIQKFFADSEPDTLAGQARQAIESAMAENGIKPTGPKRSGRRSGTRAAVGRRAAVTKRSREKAADTLGKRYAKALTSGRTHWHGLEGLRDWMDSLKKSPPKWARTREGVDAIMEAHKPYAAKIRQRAAKIRKMGDIPGSPPSDVKTVADHNAKRAMMRGWAELAPAARYWYEKSGEVILKIAGGNKRSAANIINLISITSAQTPVSANWVYTMQMWTRYKSALQSFAGESELTPDQVQDTVLLAGAKKGLAEKQAAMSRRLSQRATAKQERDVKEMQADIDELTRDIGELQESLGGLAERATSDFVDQFVDHATENDFLFTGERYGRSRDFLVGKGGQIARTAEGVLFRGEMWDGRKTNNFYINLMRNVDPEGKGHPDNMGTTVDVHIMRAVGYGSDVPSDAQYDYGEFLFQQIADDMGWEVQQVQASIWEYQKYDREVIGRRQTALNKAKNRKAKPEVIAELQQKLDDAIAVRDRGDVPSLDFADMAASQVTTMTYEATPYRGTGPLAELMAGQPLDIQKEYLAEMEAARLDEDGEDIIDGMLGLHTIAKRYGTGQYKGDQAAGAQHDTVSAFAPHSKQGHLELDPKVTRLLDAKAAMIGLFYRQDAVAYYKPYFTGSLMRKFENAMRLNLGQQITAEQMTVLEAAIQEGLVERLGEEAGTAAAEGMVLVPHDFGVIVLNSHGVSDAKADQIDPEIDAAYAELAEVRDRQAREYDELKDRVNADTSLSTSQKSRQKTELKSVQETEKDDLYKKKILPLRMSKLTVDNTTFHAIIKKAAEALPDGKVKAESFGTNGNYISNTTLDSKGKPEKSGWKENPNGDGYRHGIRAGGFGSVLRRAEVALQPRFDAINQRWEQRLQQDTGKRAAVGQRAGSRTDYGRGLSGRGVRTGQAQTNDAAQKVTASAEAYLEDNRERFGLEESLPHDLVNLDETRSRTIGQQFEDAPDTELNKPEVRAAYEQLAEEVLSQYQHIVDSDGMTFTFGNDGYKNSEAMMADVADNSHMQVYRTSPDSFGSKEVSADHPLLEGTGIFQGDYELVYNDLFRAVHDYYGHVADGNQFGAVGEERAWAKHVTMFSPQARTAMTSETRGQNSWVNYGPQMFDKDGWRGDKDHPRHIHPNDRPFAVQKVFLLPDDVSTPKFEGGRAAVGRRQTDTPAFKKWVGDSKVVDENGEAKVVYHATNADFDTFAEGISWFGSADFASAYAKARFGYWKTSMLSWEQDEVIPTGVSVMPVFVRSENPLDAMAALPDMREALSESHADWLARETGADATSLLEAAGRVQPDRKTIVADLLRSPEGIAAIRSAGFDGLHALEANAEVWAVFEPNQIKSATGNRGTFDPSDPGVRAAIAKGSKLDGLREHLRKVKAERKQKEKKPSRPVDKTPEPPTAKTAEPAEPSDDPVTSIKNEVVNELRERRGRPELTDVAAETQQEWLDRAEAILVNDPGRGDRLAKEINKKPRNLSNIEVAVMQLHYRALNNQFKESSESLFAANDSGDSVAAAIAQTDVDIVDLALAEVEDAAKAAGREWGRAGVARQITLAKDFSLAGMMRRARVANAGAPLSAKQQSEITAMSKTIENLEGRLSTLEQDKADREREVRVDKGIAEDKRKSKRTGRKAKARKKVDDAWAEFESLAKGAKLFSTPFELLVPAGKLIAAYTELGVVSFGEFMANVSQRIGADAAEKTRDTFADAWEEAKAKGEIPTPEIDSSDLAGVTRLARRIQRAMVESGITERDVVVDAVHESLQEIVPDITRREAMDALSAYGQFTPLEQTEIDRIITDINGELLQLAKLEDMEAGKAPKGTGKGRPTLSETGRRLVKLVNEAKKRGGFDTTDAATQLKSALDAAKTATRNRISDLNHEIRTREKIVRTKNELQPDVELTELRKQRDALLEVHRALFPKQKATQAQRIAAANRALDKAISGLEAQLKTGDVSPRKQQAPISTPELDAKRARLAALHDQRDALRALANPKMTPEERATKAYKASLTKRIADYQERIANKEFNPKPKKEPRKLDSQSLKLKKQLEDVKGEFFTAAAGYRRDNMSLGERTLDYAKETAHLSRAAMTSFDLSAVARQGGAVGYGHPVLAAKASKEMLKALGSRQAEFDSAEKIRNDPLYQMAMTAKLSITEEEGNITRQEEAFMGRWAKKVPGIAASGRAYTTFLNSLRFDLFRQMVENLGRSGQVTQDEAKVIARYINVATGRADIGRLNEAAAHLNMVFFAPRYVASRFQYLAMPFYLPFTKTSGRVKKLIAAEYSRTAVGLATFIGLTVALGSLLAGDDDDDEKPTVELDPRSSDFLKIRIGDTRIDPMFGLSQVMVVSARVLGGKTKSSVSGEIRSLRGPDRKHTDQGTVEVIGRFLRSKLAPVPGAMVTATTVDWETGLGVDFVGNEIPFVGNPLQPSIVRDIFVPLSFHEVKDTMEARGIPAGTAISILGLLGMGLGTYGPKTRYRAGTAEEREKQFKTGLRNMQWDSLDPDYSEFLNEDQLEQVRVRREERKQSVVDQATKEPDRDDYNSDETYEKSLETREKNRETLKEAGWSHYEAQQHLSNHYHGKQSGNEYWNKFKALAELYGKGKKGGTDPARDELLGADRKRNTEFGRWRKKQADRWKQERAKN